MYKSNVYTIESLLKEEDGFTGLCDLIALACENQAYRIQKELNRMIAPTKLETDLLRKEAELWKKRARFFVETDLPYRSSDDKDWEELL